jgi:uncharacterized protein with FMN-binding domain
MIITNFKNKSICVCLVFVLLLQSCAVYHKTPVSIADATATNNKVLVTKTDDTKLKFKKIELTDGIYYGIAEDNKGKMVKTPLKDSEIKTIRILDKSNSTVLTIGIIVVPLVIVAVILFGDWGPGNIGWGE